MNLTRRDTVEVPLFEHDTVLAAQMRATVSVLTPALALGGDCLIIAVALVQGASAAAVAGTVIAVVLAAVLIQRLRQRNALANLAHRRTHHVDLTWSVPWAEARTLLHLSPAERRRRHAVATRRAAEGNVGSAS